MKLKFKPEDFHFGGDWPGEDKAAEQATTRLAEILKDAPSVFVSFSPEGDVKAASYRTLTKTHRALLVNIEEIDDSE